jgi:hypothetical protein
MYGALLGFVVTDGVVEPVVVEFDLQTNLKKNINYNIYS